MTRTRVLPAVRWLESLSDADLFIRYCLARAGGLVTAVVLGDEIEIEAGRRGLRIPTRSRAREVGRILNEQARRSLILNGGI